MGWFIQPVYSLAETDLVFQSENGCWKLPADRISLAGNGVDFIPVAVNVSAYQILHSDLSSIVSEVLDKTKLDPQCLILEITESISRI